jgi:hypothetical protein
MDNAEQAMQQGAETAPSPAAPQPISETLLPEPKTHNRVYIYVTAIIIILLLGAVLYGIYARKAAPTAITTTIPTTTVSPTTSTVLETNHTRTLSLSGLAQPSNVLYGVPQSPQLYDYYNASNPTFYTVQYGANFTKSFVQSPSSPPINTTLNVPGQYANLTSPIMVTFFIENNTNYAAANSTYYSALSGTFSTFPNVTSSNFNVGYKSTLLFYKGYGLDAYAVQFLHGTYYVMIETFGTQKLSANYIKGISEHINATMGAALNG